MPTLSLTLKTDQAARVEAALRQVYRGGAMSNATLEAMARDYVISTLTALVTNYERSQAIADVEKTLSKEL